MGGCGSGARERGVRIGAKSHGASSPGPPTSGTTGNMCRVQSSRESLRERERKRKRTREKRERERDMMLNDTGYKM